MLVGASTPPLGSTVTATTPPSGTGAVEQRASTCRRRPMSPARCGFAPDGMTQASYVLPFGAAGRLRDGEHRPPVGRDRERAVAALAAP